MVALAMRWKLRELMARQKVKSVQLAKAMGVHPVSVARWRAVDEMPALTQAQIQAIAAALNVEVVELLGLD